MSVLRVSLFGGVRIAHGSGPFEADVTRTVQGLLAYLLLHRDRAHPRQALAGLFWGDASEDRARHSLSTALWRLRKVLEPDSTPRGTYLTTNSVGDVGFNCAAMHWLDVEVLEKRTKPVVGKPIDEVTSSAVAKLGKALELYTAELLEGFYEDWALRERERLRMLYLNSLAYLMHYHRHRGAYDKALTSGLQILRHDPLREQVHRDVMQLYLETGQRTLALRQYETCRALLATELGVPPMKATQDLYAQLLSESSSPPPAVASGDEPVTLEQVMRQLRAAIHDFGAAEAKLAHVIQLLERVSERRIRR